MFGYGGYEKKVFVNKCGDLAYGGPPITS